MSFHAVDFGTSNSLLNYVSSEGKITPVPLEKDGNLVLRSLFYTPEKNKWFFGKEAIDEYVTHLGEGRFFRSVKKFLPEPSYIGTEVFNRKMSISDLIAVILREMRLRANQFTGVDVKKVVLGRPALYSLEPANDKLAQDRMEAAARLAGYEEVVFCPEPIAAGLDYVANDQEEKIILITDFGGGTSDFTLMKIHKGKYSQDDILGLSGIFSAGDVLDGMMMKDFISPHFGSKYEYQIPGGENVLQFPRNLLKKMCSPAHITHLRERDTWEFLQQINKFALSDVDKQRMQNLFNLVECQLGFPLFHEIEKTKIRLGSEKVVPFEFQALGMIQISDTVDVIDYRESVRPTVEDIMETMMDVFTQSGKLPSDVAQVCLTGGTSQFPLIKEKLGKIFGKEKLYEHSIYQSVVNGLSKYSVISS
jgi:hypothetical chaperone protein